MQHFSISNLAHANNGLTHVIDFCMVYDSCARDKSAFLSPLSA